jgi:beta-galactosidase
LNCVETYCPWNLHEPQPDKFDFSGIVDIERFIQTAEKVGLKVIIRPGPFICAEWEHGGLPAWLLKDPSMRFRVNHEPYLKRVRSYFHKLFSVIRPYLHENGGPVIAMAIENEYGSFGDDFSYLSALEEIYRDEQMNCLYFSADGEREVYLCTGSHPHILKAVDFTYQKDVSMEDRLKPSDKYMDGKAPYFVVEYWGGAHTHWGESFRQRNDEEMKSDFSDMIRLGASFNDYVFFGGTNFGLMGGANCDHHGQGLYFAPQLTTYDYDAALTEWGDYTQRYYDIRELISKVSDEPLPELPPRPEFQYVGQVPLTESASLFDCDAIAEINESVTAESMEYYGQDYGYIRYSKVMSYDAPYEFLTLYGVADRAHVYLNGELLGIRTRAQSAEEPLPLPNGLKRGDRIDVLVENMGRINFGTVMFRGDRKGILDGIYGSDRLMTNFKVFSYRMNTLNGIEYKEGTDAKLPAFFRGNFEAEKGNSCFVRFDAFKKGLIWINGFMLGRYWEIGPQEALYIPGSILNEENEIVIFETDGLRGMPAVEITNRHGLVGKTH